MAIRETKNIIMGQISLVKGVFTGFLFGSIFIFLARFLAKKIKMHGITNTSRAPSVPDTISMTSPVLSDTAVMTTIGMR